MSRAKSTLLQKLVHEVRKTLLVTAFFLVGFNLLALLLVLLAPGYPTTVSPFITASVTALVLGKVMVLSEGMLGSRLARSRGFARAVVQKSAVFTLIMLAALFLESYLHAFFGADLGAADALFHVWQEASAARFIARAIYLMLLFVLYSILFELDPYFAPQSIVDVMLSRYHSFVRKEVVVLRLGLSAPLPEASHEQRVLFMQAAYARLAQIAREHHAELELFAGARALFVWENLEEYSEALSENIAREAENYFKQLSARYLPQAEAAELALCSAVARGPIYTYEVSAHAQREILRDGPVIDEVDRNFAQAQSARMAGN